MKKVLIVALAALSLAACGQKNSSWSGPTKAELRLNNEKARVATEGVAANEELIAGGWCSLDESSSTVSMKLEKGNSAAIVKSSKEEQETGRSAEVLELGSYSIEEDGKMKLGDQTVDVKVAAATSESPKVLSVTSDDGKTEVFEACEFNIDSKK